MIVQRNTEAHQGPYTDGNCVIVEGPIREDRRVKVREVALQKAIVQCYTLLGNEDYREGKFNILYIV
jgi:hypothetical protein